MTPPTHDRRRAAGTFALVAWTGGLGAAIWFLTRIGSGGLASPPLASPGAIREWAARRDTAEIVMAVVRLVGLALAWYLIALTVAGALLRLFRSRRLVDAADRVTPPWVRRLLDGTVGVGLSSAAVLGAIVPAVTDGRAPPLELAGAEQVEAEGTARQSRLEGTARQRQLADDDAGPTIAPHLGPAIAPHLGPTIAPHLGPVSARPRPAVEAVPADIEPEPPAIPPVWVTAPGDHLWRIAEETLVEAEGRPVGDRRVAVYWRELIEANRDVLVDRDNPDLVYPGQVFTLPPLPADGDQGR